MSVQITENKTVAAPHEEADPAPERLRFGDFEIEPRSRELYRRDGRRVPLQPQPLRLLTLLAHHPGQAIERERIRRCLWGEETFVDHEQGINFAVRQIRQALGDDAQSPRFVETVPGVGYRFLATVEPAGEVAAATEAGDAPAASRRRRRRRRRLLLAAGLACLLAALVWMAAWDAHREGAARPRLAVLPILDLSEQASDEHLAEGFSEELITHLSRRLGNRVDVLALASSRKTGRSDPTAAAAALGADYLLLGSVRRSATTLRVTVRLVAADGSELWPATYDRRHAGDLMSVESEVAARVAEALGLKLQAGEPTVDSAPDPHALEASWRGKRWLRLARQAPAGEAAPRLALARRELRAAVAADPGLAGAWIGLAEVEMLGAGPTGVEKARRHLGHALSLDDGLDVAHRLGGELALFYDLDLPAARRALERAAEINPGRAANQFLLAIADAAQGRERSALARARRALALNPLDGLYAVDACWFAYFARRHEEARAIAERSLALDLEDPTPAHRCQVAAATAAGDHEAAAVAARRDARHRDGPWQPVADESAERYLGRYWRWRLAETEGPDGVPVDHGDAAVAELALGRPAPALDHLETAFLRREGVYWLFVAVSPDFDPLRGEPRFERLVERLAR